ncbi:thiamine pyrophosphate-binding protein [Ramlibacter tataouinensis]|uniref:thiamine pyrophosphate-binding protein n=1 Tax=Ramlibacter tataouinensis TaxID=94132 RepID=UPI0022F3BFBE|nr:thiamine pyrophosphate-binding protein [Ramlibacter tataouinensis]WBY02776.1 thiamine pyrophosphate-binding protein [Ramlibacter tataouinensis]
MTVETLVREDAGPADLVGLVLEQAGIDHVFGIAGGHAGLIWTGLSRRQNRIRTVLVRHESLAGVMAEVYGRLTGRPGVMLGQGPWVMGNGMIGTLEAHLSSSPMLVLADLSDTPDYSLHAPYQSATGDYGSWDARTAFRGITKQVMQATTPGAAVHATQLALKHALAGQPGPVAVLYSLTALQGTVTAGGQPRLYPTERYIAAVRQPARAEDVKSLLEVCAGARKPVIVAGNGIRISRAFKALQRFAERSGIPVVTTASGKGCFAETHPLALGVFGTFGTPAANACVAEADLVIVVGSKLGASDTAREAVALLDPCRQTFIQIDVEPRNAAWTFPCDHVVIGDAGTVLDQLTDGLDRPLHGGASRVAGHRRTLGYFDPPQARSDAAPVMPQRIIAELQRALPPGGIVTCDAGENRIFMTHYYQTKEAGGFLQAAGAGPMGFAIPAAMAAKLVHPDRPVVAVCGDGGFSMTMNGLFTAVEERIPIIVLVFNNHALGWSMHLRGSFGTKFAEFDHAAIAQSMGCLGIRVTNPGELAGAFERALASGVPTVIDVETSLDASYHDVTYS